MMNEYTVIGLMSGTSLDGLDLACCLFKKDKQKWGFNILQTESIPYQEVWVKNLSDAYQMPIENLKEINIQYGHFLAQKTLDFINRNKLKPDFIASHGHTIFHNPDEGLSLQIGDGDQMASILKLPVIYDFRSLDISLGGQGAPLVPIGDQLLFGHHDFCLNLGGFANISYDLLGERLAQDICPVNMALNNLSQRIGFDFDKNGILASEGNLNNELLNKLNNIHFYELNAPKSLSREWFENDFLPIIEKSSSETRDLLRTVTEHIAIQITKTFDSKSSGSVLITGGGAHNAYLIKRIQTLSKLDLILPDPQLINFKEAIVFAFLGALRMNNEVNCLSSATGASKDCSGGRIAFP